jgi:hypothetical protein
LISKLSSMLRNKRKMIKDGVYSYLLSPLVLSGGPSKFL